MRRVRVNGKLYPVELEPLFRWWNATTWVEGRFVYAGASSLSEALRLLRQRIAEELAKMEEERRKQGN